MERPKNTNIKEVILNKFERAALSELPGIIGYRLLASNGEPKEKNSKNSDHYYAFIKYNHFGHIFYFNGFAYRTNYIDTIRSAKISLNEYIEEFDNLNSSFDRGTDINPDLLRFLHNQYFNRCLYENGPDFSNEECEEILTDIISQHKNPIKCLEIVNEFTNF